MCYMNRGVVVALNEAANRVIDLVDLPHVAAFGNNTLALRDKTNVSNYW